MRSLAIYSGCIVVVFHCKKKVSDIPAGGGKIANLFYSVLALDFAKYVVLLKSR